MPEAVIHGVKEDQEQFRGSKDKTVAGLDTGKVELYKLIVVDRGCRDPSWMPLLS